jgi:hypothetical protein
LKWLQGGRANTLAACGVVTLCCFPPEALLETLTRVLGRASAPGTTGFSAKDLKDMMEFADMSTMGAIVSPSFSIGLAMVQQAAQNATFHYTNVEVRGTAHSPPRSFASTHGRQST